MDEDLRIQLEGYIKRLEMNESNIVLLVWRVIYRSYL
jgi:hypothetical protein